MYADCILAYYWCLNLDPYLNKNNNCCISLFKFTKLFPSLKSLMRIPSAKLFVV